MSTIALDINNYMPKSVIVIGCQHLEDDVEVVDSWSMVASMLATNVKKIGGGREGEMTMGDQHHHKKTLTLLLVFFFTVPRAKVIGASATS